MAIVDTKGNILDANGAPVQNMNDSNVPPPGCYFSGGCWRFPNSQPWVAGKPPLSDYDKAMAQKTEIAAAYEAALEKRTRGLRPNEFRDGGLIRVGSTGKVDAGREGGYVDDSSWLSDYAEKRTARRAAILKTQEDERIAIEGLIEATEFYEEAVARRFKSHDVVSE